MSSERTPLTFPEVASAVPRSAEEDAVREFLVFEVADELYGLPLHSIRQIVRPPRITPVPRAAPDVLGVIPVRGAVTTLIDLRLRLRVESRAAGPRSRVLLVDHGDEVLGLLVDQVLQVVRFGPSQLELASVLGGDAAAYVLGIGRPTARLRASGTALAHSTRMDASPVVVLLDPLALLKQRAQSS